jgi:hypothetical protein
MELPKDVQGLVNLTYLVTSHIWSWHQSRNTC